MMSSKENNNRNWLVILIFVISLLLIIYIINVFGVFGLIWWEVAYYLLIPFILGAIWAYRSIHGVKKLRIPKYKHKLVVFSLIVFIGFSVFAVIPFAYVQPLGDQFERKFEEKFGENYWQNIPGEYRKRLKSPGNYYDNKDYRYFRNQNVSVKKDIKYGGGEYQIMDKYEDKTIKGDDKPGLIWVHGGGTARGSNKEEAGGVRSCTYFASLGFVSFSIEYTSALVKPFPQGVKDMRKAIVHIKRNAEKYDIDNESIALMGPSRGGHLVTLCAYTGANNDSWWQEHGGNYTVEDLEVACVVDLYGAVDPFYPAKHGNNFLARRNEILFDGTPEEKEKLYRKHTVKNYVSDNCPPTLILQGTQDRMVWPGESRELHKELNKENVFNIYLEINFGQHGFDAVPGTAGNDLAYYFIPRFILLVLYG